MSQLDCDSEQFWGQVSTFGSSKCPGPSNVLLQITVECGLPEKIIDILVKSAEADTHHTTFKFICPPSTPVSVNAG